MGRLAKTALLLVVTVAFISCTDEPQPENENPTEIYPGGNEETGDEGNNDVTTMSGTIKIEANGTMFTATLDDNAAARAFAAMLPLTLDMQDLNGNEKYFYLDAALPASPYNPATIHAGDLMLYGSACVVLFYETFSSGYSYTRLGRIDDPSGLVAAVGSGNATVSFFVAED